MFVHELGSRMMVNRAIWGIGLALQAALVYAVFGRGVARRFPAFTALIAFYPVRAASLFVLSSRIEQDDYDTTVHVLSMLELALQAWLIVEILQRLVGAAGGWTWRRGMALLVLLAIGFYLTTVTFHLLPMEQPADRVQIAVGFVMMELFGVALKAADSRNLVLIPAGFAAFALLELVSLTGCAYATAHQNTGAYIAWSYLPGCGYLAVVAFWIAGLRGKPASSQS